MRPLVTMRAALADPDLFGPFMLGDSWRAWRIMLTAIIGEELTPEERITFELLTKRDVEPGQLIECFTAIIGRRGGKSRAAAILATFIACLCDHSGKMVVGERPLVLCIAQNQRQAGVVFGYVAGIIENIPALARMVVGRTADSLTLSNGVAIEVRPASFRGLRGVTALAIICDESCFWYSNDDNSSNADSEILAAVRPSLATTGGPLVLISSPYSRRGETWEIYKRNFGPEGDPLVLVAQGASRDFNPSLPQKVVDRALEADPAAAAAEYLGQWRSDIEGFLSREAVEGCVPPGVYERAPIDGVHYVSFVDPSGGSSDDMTLGVAHKDGEVIILDCLRAAKPPFSPEAVVKEFAQVLWAYGLNTVTGDRYAGEWPREAFYKHGISYICSERPKSDIYKELLPIINAGHAELLDNQKLVSQLISLERRTARGGRDSIDHPPGAHDDIANAAAGAIVTAQSARRGRGLVFTSVSF